MNRLVVIFLEQAELRAKERKELTLDYWRGNVDRLLEFNDRQVLSHHGNIGTEQMKAVVHERYESFDARRRKSEAVAADDDDLRALEAIEQQAKDAKKGQ